MAPDDKGLNTDSEPMDDLVSSDSGGNGVEEETAPYLRRLARFIIRKIQSGASCETIKEYVAELNFDWIMSAITADKDGFSAIFAAAERGNPDIIRGSLSTEQVPMQSMVVTVQHACSCICHTAK
ncbi:hypothetical protein AJ80_02455 [Polytolypa hystricis UAMH7299]|uniref:Uncharacterized protein n=1 Tax=Polytolypa hystricis (strain UAMH7299) TaxID=1447883 RepID=A0A2B7YR13_POLH7|nr:hypothetical protein AJ80_02455 [Polytolypa hystricis UAMH7299]